VYKVFLTKCKLFPSPADFKAKHAALRLARRVASAIPRIQQRVKLNIHINAVPALIRSQI
jgi:hypothetical protein